MRKIPLVLIVFSVVVFVPQAQGLTVHPGSQGTAVDNLNSKLASLGYLPASTHSNYYSSQTTFAIEAFQKQTGLSRDGIAGIKTLTRLRRATRPHPYYLAPGRRAEVSLGKQLLYLIKNNQVRRIIPISSGRPGLSTPSGYFHVYSQYLRSWSHKYHSWMPYASYFSGGYALHGYPNYEVPVYPASHGCVRVPMDFAAEVYHFLQIGDAVRIY